MKKVKTLLAALCAMLTTALFSATAYADLIIPGQPRQPSPTPPVPVPDPTPVPDPAPAQTDPTLLTALIVGVAVIAAAVIVWLVIRKRRAAVQ